jgi:membrane associated rhomboid family serine protease
MAVPLPQVPTPSRPRSQRILPPAPVLSLLVMLVFTAVLYVTELVDAFTGQRLNDDGIHPRDPEGLLGVIWGPLLHANWDHLIANTLPFLIFGFLAMAVGLGRWLAVTAIIWVVGGLGVWLVGPSGSSTIGASGVIFGWLTFLLARGFFNRSGKQILLALVLLFLWGGILLGVLPGNPGVSWQAHLFGALGGVLAAWVMAIRRRGSGVQRA